MSINFLSPDLGYGFAPGVSGTCMTAYLSVFTGMATSCSMVSVDSTLSYINDPSVTDFNVKITDVWMNNTFLPSLCSASCKTLIDSIPATLGAACGSQQILNSTSFSGAPINANTLASYATLTYNLGCINPFNYGISATDNYCASETIPYIYAMVFMPSNTNVFPALFSSYNPCSQCTSAMISAVSSSTWFVDYQKISGYASAIGSTRTNTCPSANAYAMSLNVASPPPPTYNPPANTATSAPPSPTSSSSSGGMIDFSSPSLGYGFAQGISQSCQAGFLTIMQDLGTKCGLSYLATALPALMDPNLSINTIQILRVSMNSTFQSAIGSLQASLTSTCGTSSILAGTTFSGSPMNAAAIASYASAVSSIGCVQSSVSVPSSYKYCAAEVIPPLYSVFFDYMNPAIMNGIGAIYTPCTPCTGALVNAVGSATSFVDLATLGAMSGSVINMRNQLCQPPSSSTVRSASTSSSRPTSTVSASTGTNNGTMTATAPTSTATANIKSSADGQNSPMMMALSVILSAAIGLITFA